MDTGGTTRSGRTAQIPPLLEPKTVQPRERATDLLDVLRTGPFEAALDSAVRASGLSLERIQHRLAERGVEISVTTLSYWRRGRSRPERPQSRQAVRLLEELLGIPTDGLVSLLGPRRPRGRWVNRDAVVLETEHLWREFESLPELLAELDSTDDGLLRVAAHDSYELDARGAGTRLTTRLVLKATRDRVDRCVVVLRGEDPDTALPEFTDVRNARLGRLRSDRSVPLMVIELFLDRTLSEGGTTLIEYTLRFPENGRRAEECGRGFPAPALLYTLEVSFHPDAVPVRCRRCFSAAIAGEPVSAEPVWISAAGRAHAVFENPGPGYQALSWEWH
ncbi:hypothetical protein GCM10010275_55920 [Streptomyces litmocidini]|uniref:hypothetical protein n=1 Tax=Streptomyces litmocidini TaxID=67318 RepID=UPI00167E13DB|nr:hypothetical protein [Streptomyces litmocidini]GGV08410.1 hypothetical protein GCM10010275_55920 [Streptomyces litmocidini]